MVLNSVIYACIHLVKVRLLFVRTLRAHNVHTLLRGFVLTRNEYNAYDCVRKRLVPHDFTHQCDAKYITGEDFVINEETNEYDF